MNQIIGVKHFIRIPLVPEVFDQQGFGLHLKKQARIFGLVDAIIVDGPASERGGNSSKRVKGFNLKARAIS